jgi:hypothetical protein
MNILRKKRINIESTFYMMAVRRLSKAKQLFGKVQFVPLEELNFQRATKSDFPVLLPKIWNSREPVAEITITQAVNGIKGLKEKHLAVLQQFENRE